MVCIFNNPWKLISDAVSHSAFQFKWRKYKRNFVFVFCFNNINIRLQERSSPGFASSRVGIYNSSLGLKLVGMVEQSLVSVLYINYLTPWLMEPGFSVSIHKRSPKSLS